MLIPMTAADAWLPDTMAAKIAALTMKLKMVGVHTHLTGL